MLASKLETKALQRQPDLFCSYFFTYLKAKMQDKMQMRIVHVTPRRYACLESMLTCLTLGVLPMSKVCSTRFAATKEPTEYSTHLDLEEEYAARGRMGEADCML